MKVLKIIGLAAGGLIAAVVVAVLVFNWNWLKPLVEARASAAIGRQVTIENLDVDLGRTALVKLDGVAIDNAEGFEQDYLATVGTLAIRVDLFALLKRRAVLSEISVIRPWAQLERRETGGASNGQAGHGGEVLTNYALDIEREENPPPDQGPGLEIEIGQLTIVDGDIRYIDPSQKTNMQVNARTDAPDDSGEAALILEGEGQFNGEKSSIGFRGGSLLSFRDPEKPYPVDFTLRVGNTRSSLKGTIEQPLKLGGAKLTLDLAGTSLAQLYPIVGIPAPSTPKYTLKGELDFSGKTIILRGIKGTVGSSDLNGDFKVEIGGERPRMVGDLYSKKVVWGDLAGFIAATPKEATDHQTPKSPGDAPPQVADQRVLPTTAIELDKLRSADADLHYRVERFESDYVPIDRMLTNLKIEDGLLTMQPFEFGIGPGRIVVKLRLNGRQNPAVTEASVDFREVDLKQIMRKTKIFDGMGRIGGKATLRTNGNSVSAMLGRGTGELQLFMGSGRLSKLLLEAIGLDATEAFGFLIDNKNQQAEIRCMISDLVLRDGMMTPRILLLDTTDTNITVEGVINFKDETLDLRVVPVAKDVSILTARTPVTLRGPMRDLSIRPDAANLAGRGAAAAALGVFLTPLAALIPTIELGLGKDNDCAALIKAVQTRTRQNKDPLP